MYSSISCAEGACPLKPARMEARSGAEDEEELVCAAFAFLLASRMACFRAARLALSFSTSLSSLSEEEEEDEDEPFFLLLRFSFSIFCFFAGLRSSSSPVSLERSSFSSSSASRFEGTVTEK